jgi:sentrin-specific protease 1
MGMIAKHRSRNELSRLRKLFDKRNIKYQFVRRIGRAVTTTMKRRRGGVADVIKVDEATMEAIQAEVSNLMYAGEGSRACKVTEIATALKESSHVRDLYAYAEEKKEDDVNRVSFNFGSMLHFDEWGRKSEDNKTLQRKYEFFQVMDDLEKRSESIKMKVSTWEEARAALSVVLSFPDNSSDAVASTTHADTITAETEIFKRKVSLGLNKEKLDQKLSPAKDRWKQICLQPLPSKIADVENRIFQDSAIDLVDAKRLETLSAKYTELEERLTSPKVKAVEQRLKEKEAEDQALSLMRKLTQEEQSVVKKAIYGHGPPNEVLARIGSDSVQRRSLHLLQPGEWLNDEVIHYFLVMLANRDEELCRQDSNRNPTHFFKSFFLTKLLNEGDADPAKDGKYEYRNVRRWSKHVKGKDIFKLSKIVFPINQNQMHWICAVAFMDEKRIQAYDSMGSSCQSYLQHIFQYIKDEHMDKKGTPLPDADKWNLVPCTSDTPHQRNGKFIVDRFGCLLVGLLHNNCKLLSLGYDCGVFTCMFADFVSKDCPLVFNQTHITQCRERIALAIMKGSAIM